MKAKKGMKAAAASAKGPMKIKGYMSGASCKGMPLKMSKGGKVKKMKDSDNDGY